MLRMTEEEYRAFLVRTGKAQSQLSTADKLANTAITLSTSIRMDLSAKKNGWPR